MIKKVLSVEVLWLVFLLILSDSIGSDKVMVFLLGGIMFDKFMDRL